MGVHVKTYVLTEFIKKRIVTKNKQLLQNATFSSEYRAMSRRCSEEHVFCRNCGKPLAVGESMVSAFSSNMKKKYYHEACAKRVGII
jgi:hypothetical protein